MRPFAAIVMLDGWAILMTLVVVLGPLALVWVMLTWTETRQRHRAARRYSRKQ